MGRLNRLIDMLNKSPIAYGMKVHWTHMNTRQNKFTFVVEDEHKNSCMAFTINLSTNSMDLHSLHYEDHEQYCFIPAVKLVAWATSLVPDVVSYIDLEDGSHLYLRSEDENIRVRLKFIRKFFKGQGWYEQFGFYAINLNDRQKYNDTFESVRNIMFDDFCSFTWNFMLPFIVDETQIKFIELDETDTAYDDWYNSMKYYISHSKESLHRINVNELKNDRKMLHNFIQNLSIYGFPKNRMDSSDFLQHAQNSDVAKTYFTNHIKVRHASNKTLYQVWYPYANKFLKTPKTTEQDVVRFFTTIQSTLEFFESLGRLFVPYELRYSLQGKKRSRE